MATLFILLLSLPITGCEWCWIQDCDEADNFVCLTGDTQLTGLMEAYNTKEIGHLRCFLTDDFVFYFNPFDSMTIAADFPTLTMPRTRELAITENLFENCETIQLSLTGDGIYDYSGDPTGVLKRLPRQFELTIMFADSSGFDISGDCDFIMRPENNEYKIVKWIDFSGAQNRDIESDKSWGYLKWYFR